MKYRIGLMSSLAGACFGLATPRALAEELIDSANLDPRKSACEDFYQYACGGWIAKAEIPPDRAMWSRGFTAIDKRNEVMLNEAIAGFAKNPEVATEEQRKLGDYYAACMDEASIETSSLAALQRRLATLDAVKDNQALAVQLARLQLEGAGALFEFSSTQDAKDSSLEIGDADQGGLSLPDRDYYLKDSGKFPEIRQKYSDHVAATLVLLGASKKQSESEAKLILAFETELAKISLDRVTRRDPDAVYHRLDRGGLAKLTPDFPWDTYFAALGYPGVSAINVDVPDYFTGLGKLLAKTPWPTIRVYLRWHVVRAAAPTLGKAFVDEDFQFTKALTGQKAQPPRWKRCVGATLHAMAQPVGKVFVEKTFGPSAKADAQAMVDAVEAAMAETLKGLPWMDEATRKKALEKLGRVVNQIGYPDQWRDYAALKVGRSSYFANWQAATVFGARYHLNKIGKPVDRSEWGMPPSMVNAYYDADNNKMVFPAGILQNPFYDKTFPPALNYGAIGMVMGHELTHGYDDEGRKFDADGNLKDWWSPQVGKEFEKRAACLVKQYDSYVVLEDIHLNGKATLGENIADNGGIKLAYGAWLKTTGGKGESIAGFTPAQQFFLGFAQSWCTKEKPELARLRAATDPHSSARFRVNGPLSNFDEFAKAFGCQAGSPMAPQQQCKIW